MRLKVSWVELRLSLATYWWLHRLSMSLKISINRIPIINYFFGWLGGWLEKVELRLTSALVWVEVELSWGWAWQKHINKRNITICLMSKKYDSCWHSNRGVGQVFKHKMRGDRTGRVILLVPFWPSYDISSSEMFI